MNINILKFFLVSIFLFVIAGCADISKPTDLQVASGLPLKQNGSRPDLTQVKALLDAGKNVDEIGWGGETALRTAIAVNASQIIDYLLDHGANPNAPSMISQDSLLMMAVTTNNRLLVEKLIAKGANVNYVNVFDESALSRAASLGNAEMVDYLLSRVADKYSQAQSAFVACSNGIKINISQPANPGEPANNRNYKFVAIFEMLLKAGANVNATSKSGQYALHNATFAANAEVVRYLLKIGANPNITDGLRNETPLNIAIRVKGESANRNNIDMQRKYDEVIAVLKPVTSTLVQMSKTDTALTETNLAINVVTECLKLKAALKVCENIPWPVSLGCNALAKSNYGNSYCPM